MIRLHTDVKVEDDEREGLARSHVIVGLDIENEMRSRAITFSAIAISEIVKNVAENLEMRESTIYDAVGYALFNREEARET